MHKKITINEEFVVQSVIKYLQKKGYQVYQDKKGYEHGIDIKTHYHKKLRKQYLIEAKGDAGIKPTTAVIVKHNAFYYMLGQILSRMDKQGNNTNKGRIYAIAIPAHWQKTFTKKIKNMTYAWKLLKLKTFLVEKNGIVTEQPHTYFLKK